MLIDKILPQVVAVKGSLRERLAAEGAAIGLAEGDTATLWRLYGPLCPCKHC